MSLDHERKLFQDSQMFYQFLFFVKIVILTWELPDPAPDRSIRPFERDQMSMRAGLD